tara:strand:- start:3436 stop:4335 length:900 start_codon:yes stop_codon:yes gene_type:complete
MSKLVSPSFNRNSKLDPAPLNSKFQDVATAVNTQIDETNIRDSSIDTTQFKTITNNGKSGIQLVHLETGSVGLTGGTNVDEGSLTTPVLQSGTFNVGTLTLTEDDIIRVYWHTRCYKNYNAPSGKPFLAQMRDHFFAQYLEWSFNGAAYTPVPGQTNFNNTTPDGSKIGALVTNTKGTSFIHYAVIADNGSTAANETPTDANPNSSADSILLSDFRVETSNSEHTLSGSWIHKVTAAQAVTGPIEFRVKMQGPVTPYYDNTGGSENNYLVHSTATNLSTINPSVNYKKTFLVFMVMRSK